MENLNTISKHAKRDNSLDALKGIMILLVVYTHSHIAENSGNNPMNPLFVDMAVPVFMVITGYANAMQIERKGLDSWWQRDSLIRKMSRIILPFIVCVIADIFIWLFVSKVGIKWTVAMAVFQQWGAGGYYPFVMIQIIVIFPILFRLSRTLRGIVSVITVNIITEMLFGITSELTGGGYITGYHLATQDADVSLSWIPFSRHIDI